MKYRAENFFEVKGKERFQFFNRVCMQFSGAPTNRNAAITSRLISCAFQLAAAPISLTLLPVTGARGQDNIWAATSLVPHLNQLSNPVLQPYASKLSDKARAGPSAVAYASRAEPTMPLQASVPTSRERTQPSPAWSGAGWDLYASASLALVAGSRRTGAQTSVRTSPAVVASWEVGPGRVAVHGAINLPLYNSRPTAMLGYRAGLAWDIIPAADLDISLRIDAARFTGDAVTTDAGLESVIALGGQQFWCGQPAAYVKTCDLLTARAEVRKLVDDYAIAASIAGAASRWSTSDGRQARFSGGAASIQARVSRQISHLFAPYIEAQTIRWHEQGADGGESRFVIGAAFPEISLFSGRLYSGADFPNRSPVLPVIGGTLTWSPRRALVIGALAEAGASRMPPFSSELRRPGARIGRNWSGRRMRIGLTGRWALTPELNLALAADRTSSEWRISHATAPKLVERQDDLRAQLSWAFAPQWIAGLELVGSRINSRPQRKQKRLIATFNLRRMI